MTVDYDINQDEFEEAWRKEQLCFTQHPAWGKVKSHNYTTNLISADGAPVLVMTRKLPAVGGEFGYCPRMLNIKSTKNANWLAELSEQICKRLGLTHLVLEPNVILDNPDATKECESVGFKLNKRTLQPRHSRLIDLKKSEAELLADMAKDVRRRIKRAQDNAYKIEEQSDPAALELFYEGLSGVAHRAKFNIQPKNYFTNIVKYFPEEMRKIYLVSDKKNELLYATFVINDGEAFRRIYGGPTLAGRSGDAAQFTAWETILAAKKLKAATLDLWGVAPYTDEGYIDGHHLSGVSRFKANLGGYNVTYWPQLIWVADKKRYLAYDMMVKGKRRVSKLKQLLG